VVEDEISHAWFHAAVDKPQLEAQKTGSPDGGGRWFWEDPYMGRGSFDLVAMGAKFQVALAPSI
jgi:hypothetical protein